MRPPNLKVFKMIFEALNTPIAVLGADKLHQFETILRPPTPKQRTINVIRGMKRNVKNCRVM